MTMSSVELPRSPASPSIWLVLVVSLGAIVAILAVTGVFSTDRIRELLGFDLVAVLSAYALTRVAASPR